ncbi:MAG: hypothetical protein IKM76_11545 [Prevotella sp.]|nr:hypothetical protein [Prevotella sp.]MBR6867128.1 hypothetical protein [Prevotella sp.]
MWIWIVIVLIGSFILGLITHKEDGEKERKPNRKSLWKQLKEWKVNDDDCGSGTGKYCI